MDHYKAALQAGQMSTTLEDICEHLLRVYNDRGIMLQHVKLVGVKQNGDVDVWEGNVQNKEKCMVRRDMNF